GGRTCWLPGRTCSPGSCGRHPPITAGGSTPRRGGVAPRDGGRFPRRGARGVSQDPPGPGSAMKLKTLMGDHAVTQAFKRNTSLFDFADVKAPATAFKRVVRALEFDVAELAIVTFLLAKAHGK